MKHTMKDLSEHYPERVLEQHEVLALETSQKRELMCRLSCFPSMTSEDIAQIFGCTDKNVDQHIDRGAKAGLPSRKLFGLVGIGLTNAKRHNQPCREEWIWRLRNHNAKYLILRFGSGLCNRLRGMSLLHYAQDDLLELDEQPERETVNLPDIPMVDHRGETIDVKPMVYPVDPARPDGNVMLNGTSIEITCHNRHEQHRVNAIANWVVSRYEMTPGGWNQALPLIEMYRDYYRHIANTSDAEGYDLNTIEQRQKVYKSLLEIAKSLPFAIKKDPGDFDRFERARENAPAYLAEHGHKYAIACRVCGQIEFPYLLLYQSLSELRLQCQKFLAANLDQRSKAELILKEMHRNPYFDIQLRDIGVAWSQPLVEWGQSLMQPKPGQLRRAGPVCEFLEDHEPGEVCEVIEVFVPDGLNDEHVRVEWFDDNTSTIYPLKDFCTATVGPITWETIADGLAAQLGLGPDCFSTIEPASPISRVTRVGIDELEVAHVE